LIKNRLNVCLQPSLAIKLYYFEQQTSFNTWPKGVGPYKTCAMWI